jgi:hypothetical protein
MTTYVLASELKRILSFIEYRTNVIDANFGCAEFFEAGVGVFGKYASQSGFSAAASGQRV